MPGNLKRPRENEAIRFSASDVTFPSLPGVTFRLLIEQKVDSTVIWVENKENKLQWGSEFLNGDSLGVPGIPRDAIVNFLVVWLSFIVQIYLGFMFALRLP